MKIVFLEWNSYCRRDMIEAFESLEVQVIRCKWEKAWGDSLEETQKAVSPILKKENPEFLFSFNYIPHVSTVCQEMAVPYASYVYDNPHIQVYSYTVLNSCNHIFLFDYALYHELAKEGISTVHYLPLATNAMKLQNLGHSNSYSAKYGADISFVGSLYDEPKHRLFEKFQDVNAYTKGYLEAITQAQKQIYGYYFLEELLVPSIVQELEKFYPTDPNALTVMRPEKIYADYVLSRHVTAMERREILEMLGKNFYKHNICLYTNNKQLQIKGIKNRGMVDYDTEMPYVFANSKINLNISLKSIRTGIPLRAYDIMGCGGFLISNYQQELAEYFEADVDFVYYNHYEDLMEKVEYYLAHENERREIAGNGREKVLKEHTLQMRAKEIIAQVMGER